MAFLKTLVVVEVVIRVGEDALQFRLSTSFLRRVPLAAHMTDAFEGARRHVFCVLVSFGRGHSPDLHLVLCLSLVPMQHHCPPARIPSSPVLDGTIQARFNFGGHLI